VGLAEQVGAEDAVDDVDVVERANGVVDSAGMLGRGDGGELVEEFVVGPRFLGEEGGQQAYGVDYKFDSVLRRFYKGGVPKRLENTCLNGLQINTKFVQHELRVKIQVMKNVTITVEDDVLEWARVKAARENTSVSRLLGIWMKEKHQQEDAYEVAKRSALQFRSWGKSDGPYLTRDEMYDRTGFR
jgi:hypothetical protein